MSWSWRYDDEPAADAEMPQPETFSSQSDAETWLGEHWRELLEAGVHGVVLLRDGAVIYPMSLDPPA
jgi:hypothetical protein